MLAGVLPRPGCRAWAASAVCLSGPLGPPVLSRAAAGAASACLRLLSAGWLTSVCCFNGERAAAGALVALDVAALHAKPLQAPLLVLTASPIPRPAGAL